MARLRIAVLAGGNIPSRFAHSMSVMHMAQGFALAGAEVHVLTADTLRVRQWRRDLPEIGSLYGLRQVPEVHWIRPSLLAHLTNRASQDRVLARRSTARALELGCEAVYCRTYRGAWYAARAGLPTVVETHSNRTDQPGQNDMYRAAALPAFRGLVTIHEELARLHAERMKTRSPRTLVLEDGVDPERFEVNDDRMSWRERLGLVPNRRYVVFCGKLHADKGLDVLLETTRLLRHRTDVAFLVLGGAPEERAAWERRAREFDLAPGTIRFPGFVPGNEVPRWLKAADCLLLPYDVHREHTVMDIRTTSPLKLFEYMAAARPIVATEIPTLAKVLQHGHSALLCAPGASPLAKAIETVLLDEQLATSLAENALGEVRHYTWQERARRVLAQLNQTDGT